MGKKIRKYFALLLCVAMILTSFPAVVFASGDSYESTGPERTILTVEDNQGTDFRYNKIYLSTDGTGDYKKCSFLKINGYFPKGTSKNITWQSSDEEVVAVSYPSGTENTLVPLNSGTATIIVSCNGATVNLDVVVKSTAEVKTRVVEIAKEMPSDYNEITVADFEKVEELYSLMMTLSYSDRTAFAKAEGNEKFATCNEYYYRNAMKTICKAIISSNIEPTNGSDYDSLSDTASELLKDRAYVTGEQKTALDTITAALDELSVENRGTMSVSDFNSKLSSIRTKVKGYVTSLINSVPSSEKVTLDSENTIVVARNAYTVLAPGDKVGSGSPSELVTSKLTPAETALAELKAIVYPEKVTMSTESTAISVGGRVALTATISPEGISNSTIKWTSEDDSVATVDSDGNVKGISEGETKISATTYNGVVGTTIIKVTNDSIKVESITLDKTEKTITMGKSEKLIATVNPEGATDKDISFISSDTEIATVDAEGNIIGIKPGKADITVKSEEKNSTVSVTCKVTVTPRPSATEPTVYFRYDNGLIQDMSSDNTFTLEQSDKGYFCREGFDAEPAWFCKGDVNTTNNYIYNLYKGTGQIICNTIGEANGWVVADTGYVDKDTATHLVDFTVKIVPSTVTSIKMYVDDKEITESSTVVLSGSESKQVIVKGKKAGESEYKEIPYYALDYTSGSNVSFGTMANANKFSFDNPGAANIKVAIKNTDIVRSFWAKAGAIDVESIDVSVPETYYIDAWNPNGGEYVGLTDYAGDQRYSVNVNPNNASNKNVTWESMNPDVAIFKVQHVNGFLPLRAGTASFKVTSNADPAINKTVTINFEYKNKAKNVVIDDEHFDVTLSEGSIELPIKYTSDTGKETTEQRMDWSYSENEIVSVESTIYTTINPGVSNDKHIKHTLSPLKEGTVTVTGTPWDTTGGAEPITFTVTVTKGNYSPVDVNKVVADGITDGQKHCSSTVTGAYNDEWALFSLMRSGSTVDTATTLKYYDSIVEKLKSNPDFGAGRGTKATDLERVILAIQACGIDASNVGGTNLLERLYNYSDSLETMGANDVGFALLALDSNKTEIPAGANWTRDRLVKTLLKYQISTGGFSLGMPDASTESASIDMTAMCLTALAPYTENEEVQQAVKSGLAYLKSNINATAGYGNSNSDAQVLTALSALNIDCTKSSSGFVVGVNNLITSIEKYRVSGKGFKWQISDNDVNGMASVQVLYALDSYKRYINNEKSLYDFSDIDISDIDEFINGNPAIAVINKIEAIGTVTYSSSSKAKIDLARAAYDSLSSEYKSKVSNYSKLTAAEAAYKLAAAKYKFSKSKFSLSYTSVAYTGKSNAPTVKVTYDGKTLKKNTDYTVSYKNNKSIGTATVTITGKGNYIGTKKLTFKINPKKASIKSLAKGTKKFKVKWSKDSTVKGYQVYYAKNSKFTKSLKKVTIKSYKTTSKTITKLSKKTKYYVKVRSYKVVSGKTYYGSWSKIKTIKTK